MALLEILRWDDPSPSKDTQPHVSSPENRRVKQKRNPCWRLGTLSLCRSASSVTGRALTDKHDMGRPKRNLLATVEETSTPPSALSEGQALARITKATGSNLFTAELPSGQSVLVELPARFRSTIWIKRGSYVLIDTSTLADRDNKLYGEIINVVVNEKEWRKQSYWPVQFARKSAYGDEDSEDESNVGKMPPSDSEEEP